MGFVWYCGKADPLFCYDAFDGKRGLLWFTLGLELFCKLYCSFDVYSHERDKNHLKSTFSESISGQITKVSLTSWMVNFGNLRHQITPLGNNSRITPPGEVIRGGSYTRNTGTGWANKNGPLFCLPCLGDF
jgi:hypothetical protein